MALTQQARHSNSVDEERCCVRILIIIIILLFYFHFLFFLFLPEETQEAPREQHTCFITGDRCPLETRGAKHDRCELDA